MTDRDIQRDRLIELFQEMDKDFGITCPNINTNKSCKGCKYQISGVFIDCDYLARKVDYLLANGVIVPPYEVGTKVYVIASQTSDNRNFYIFEDIITHYHIGGGCVVMGFDNHLGVYSWNWDKVFLTKEEAEAEFEKRGKGNA